MATKNTATEYGNDSITMLKGADRVRKRPAVIFGSDGLEGCEHAVFEIVSNSVDEAREGYGNLIRITAYNDRSVEVEDEGRGVPLGYNEKEGRYNWDLIYCELYAGGKYNNNDNESAYEYSLGLNGLGACATQYASAFMKVSSYAGGTLSYIEFSRGDAKGELQVRDLDKKEKKHGTVIHWLPDLEVFTDIAIPREYYVEMLNRQAVVNEGITFLFRWQREDGSFDEQTFLYENGIGDYVTEIAGENPLTEPVLWKTETVGRDREDKPDYKLKMEIAWCATNTAPRQEYYHNSSWLEHGGSPEKAMRSGFLFAVDRYLKLNDKYRKGESKITFQDIEDCLVFVSNSFSTQTSYENQTKKAITNTFIAQAMTDYLKHQLEVFFAEHPTDAERFAGQVLVNKRSRETAENTRLDLKKKLGGTIDMTNRIDKFVNCRTKDPERRELYIVEGDSAMGSCKMGRAAEFQAIMPVRGKILNCLSCPLEKIFKNEIIVNLLKVIGCGVEVKTKSKNDMMPFDINNLKWSKIIICTDADKDGFHIRTLVLTLFYRLIPTLIREGRIFIAESPLFEINAGDQTYFAYDENEKTEILRQLEGKKYTIQRSKGLGENEPDMMWQTTMNPATRRLIQVTEADASETARIFDTLLGEDIIARKDFISLHGGEYNDIDLGDGE